MMEKQRLAALDGLRGICAVMILLFHVFGLQRASLFGHGFLSVDIFFLLSGFVLAFAFGDRLEAGLSAADFMRARIRRLGPVLWFAAGFAVLGHFIAEPFNPSQIPSAAILLAGLQNAALIPMVGTTTMDAFPLNGPSWSLFAEIWINVGLALVATRLTPGKLAILIAAGWAFLVLHSVNTGTADFGATQATVLYAIPRSVPSFAAGVLIFKLWRQGVFRRIPSVPPLIVFSVWVAVTFVPAGGMIFDLFQIMITAPLLLILLVSTSQAPPRWSLWLGRLSYPLYATHAIILHTGLRISGGSLNIWTAIGLVVLSILLADILARWYEPMMRGRGQQALTPAHSGAA